MVNAMVPKPPQPHCARERTYRVVSALHFSVFLLVHLNTETQVQRLSWRDGTI